MKILVRAAVRLLVLVLGLGAFYWVLDRVATPGDANIGVGLLAFALLLLATGGWSLLDGRRHPFREVALCWTGVGLVLATGWVVALSVGEADSSMGAGELLAANLSLLPFLAGLVVVPGVLGAAIGQHLR